MHKSYLAAAMLAGVLSVGPVQAQSQTAAPDVTKIMAPPPPAMKSDTVITILAKKKPMRGGVVDTGPGGQYLNMNSPTIDAATDVSDMSGEERSAPPTPERLFMLGRMYIAAHDHSLDDAFDAYNAEDYPKALTLFKYAYTKMGSSQAAIMVARMYLYGLGAQRNTQEAIVWLKRDASSGRAPGRARTYLTDMYFPQGAEASIALGRIYAFGYDVPVNTREARRWYARADELGYYPATHVMGDIYRTGYAGEKDLTKAIVFYKRAAMAGYGPSAYTLAQIYYLGDDGVPADRARGLAWLETSARAGYPDGLYAAGRFYETGDGGVTADPAKALVYYKEAAVKGQPDAEEAIGRAFYTGNGLPKDLKTARQWFLQGAEGANVDAMFNLAVMLINGEGGDRDLVKAWVWLKIADAGGHPQARAALVELEARMTPEEKAKAQALFAPEK